MKSLGEILRSIISISFTFNKNILIMKILSSEILEQIKNNCLDPEKQEHLEWDLQAHKSIAQKLLTRVLFDREKTLGISQSISRQKGRIQIYSSAGIYFQDLKEINYEMRQSTLKNLNFVKLRSDTYVEIFPLSSSWVYWPIYVQQMQQAMYVTLIGPNYVYFFLIDEETNQVFFHHCALNFVGSNINERDPEHNQKLFDIKVQLIKELQDFNSKSLENLADETENIKNLSNTKKEIDLDFSIFRNDSASPFLGKPQKDFENQPNGFRKEGNDEFVLLDSNTRPFPMNLVPPGFMLKFIPQLNEYILTPDTFYTEPTKIAEIKS